MQNKIIAYHRCLRILRDLKSNKLLVKKQMKSDFRGKDITDIMY